MSTKLRDLAVLVTGASGFVGRATVEALRSAGSRVTLGFRSPTRAGPDTVQLDLDDPERLLASLRGYRFDAIVHLAARIDLSTRNGADLYAPNVLATGCLAMLAARSRAHFVYTSTVMVHGARTAAIGPHAPIRPDTPYARSKWLGEKLVEASSARHCVLRVAGVFGVADDPLLGINRAIKAVRQGIAPRRIGSGGALRNYVYVRDAAAAIVSVLDSGIEGTHFLAARDALSIDEMLREICTTFLPGEQPIVVAGAESSDQLVEPSMSLPPTRSFRAALVDIRTRAPA